MTLVPALEGGKKVEPWGAEAGCRQEPPLATGGFRAACDGRRNGVPSARNPEIADGQYRDRHKRGPASSRCERVNGAPQGSGAPSTSNNRFTRLVSDGRCEPAHRPAPSSRQGRRHEGKHPGNRVNLCGRRVHLRVRAGSSHSAARDGVRHRRHRSVARPDQDFQPDGGPRVVRRGPPLACLGANRRIRLQRRSRRATVGPADLRQEVGRPAQGPPAANARRPAHVSPAGPTAGAPVLAWRGDSLRIRPLALHAASRSSGSACADPCTSSSAPEVLSHGLAR